MDVFLKKSLYEFLLESQKVIMKNRWEKYLQEFMDESPMKCL